MARLKISAAAQLAGVSRSTLHRAMNAGRISFETDDHGVRWLDPSEIARVYAGTAATPQRNGPWYAETRPSEPPMAREIALLRERIEAQESTIRDLRAERDRLLTLIEQRDQRLLPAPSWWQRWRGR